MVRPRDLLWEALVEVCGADADEMTKNERGKYNAALKQLKDVNATPEQLRARAARYKREYPNISLTPTALCNRWSSLKPPPAPASNPPPEPEPVVECRHGVKGPCPECRKDIRELIEGFGKVPDDV